MSTSGVDDLTLCQMHETGLATEGSTCPLDSYHWLSGICLPHRIRWTDRNSNAATWKWLGSAEAPPMVLRGVQSPWSQSVRSGLELHSKHVTSLETNHLTSHKISLAISCLLSFFFLVPFLYWWICYYAWWDLMGPGSRGDNLVLDCYWPHQRTSSTVSLLEWPKRFD